MYVIEVRHKAGRWRQQGLPLALIARLRIHALTPIVLFEHGMALVTHPNGMLLSPPRTRHEVRGAATAKDLSTDPAVVLSTQRREWHKAVAALFRRIIGHPVLAAEPFATKAANPHISAGPYTGGTLVTRLGSL